MACPTFHPFSRLPAELRIQIWQKTCLLNYYGLHYFILDQNRQLTLPNFGWGQLEDPQSRSNRSAYLQNLGLWAACKESRMAIVEAWHIPKWRRDRWWAETYYEEMFEDPDTTPAPAMIDNPGSFEPWRITVRPTRDIFCITATDWEPLIRKWRWPSFTANSLGDKNYVLPINYIALEYDPSWNDLLCCNDEERYASGLGFLIRLLYDLSREGPFYKTIRILDKTARWRAHPGDDRHPMCCDCDYEYIEIRYDCWLEGYREDIYESPFIEFMDKLERDLISREDWARTIGLNVEGSEGSIGVSTKPLITLLVRRDNQINE